MTVIFSVFLSLRECVLGDRRGVDEVTLELKLFLNAEIYRPYVKEPVPDAGAASWDLRIASLF